MGPNSLLYFLGKCKSLVMVMMVMRPPPHLLSLKNSTEKQMRTAGNLHSVLSLSATNSNSVVTKKMAPPSKKAFVGKWKNRVNCGREWRKIGKDKKISFVEREARFGWSFLVRVFGVCLLFMWMCVMKKNFLSSEEMHNLCGAYVKNVWGLSEERDHLWCLCEETRDDLCLYVKSFLRSEEKG